MKYLGQLGFIHFTRHIIIILVIHFGITVLFCIYTRQTEMIQLSRILMHIIQDLINHSKIIILLVNATYIMPNNIV